MHRKLGKELKRLITWASVITTSLFLVVVAYFMIDVAVTSGKNIDQNKQLIIRESVNTMQEMADSIASLSTNQKLMSRLNTADIQKEVMSGNTEALTDFMMEMAFYWYPIEYISETKDGKLIGYMTADGSKLDTSKLPKKPKDGNYVTFNKFGDKKGFFVSLYGPINIPFFGEIYTNFIVDRTDEIKQVESHLNDQRNSQLIRMGIVSFAAYFLFTLFSTLGLRLLVDRFVMQPIDTLNKQAEGIANGTLKEEIPYDSDSSFAPIQGVLRSGQKVLMDVFKEADDS